MARRTTKTMVAAISQTQNTLFFHFGQMTHTHTYLQSSCLVKVGGAYTLVYDVPLCPAQRHRQLLGIHNVFQLLSDLPDLSHCLDVDEMLGTPARGITEEQRVKLIFLTRH